MTSDPIYNLLLSTSSADCAKLDQLPKLETTKLIKLGDGVYLFESNHVPEVVRELRKLGVSGLLRRCRLDFEICHT